MVKFCVHSVFLFAILGGVCQGTPSAQGGVLNGLSYQSNMEESQLLECPSDLVVRVDIEQMDLNTDSDYATLTDSNSGVEVFHSCQVAGHTTCNLDDGTTVNGLSSSLVFFFHSGEAARDDGAGYYLVWSCVEPEDTTLDSTPTSTPEPEPTTEPTTEPTSTPEPTVIPDDVLYGLGYSNNEHVRKTLTCEEGSVVRVNVQQMDLETCCDHVLLYNSYPNDAFYRSCAGGNCKNDVGRSFYSSGPMTVFTFDSDYSITYSGFYLVWDCVDASLAPTPTPTPTPTSTPTPTNDHVLSGIGYVNNEQILRTFECAEGQVVQFDIQQMDLETCCDFVRLFNSYPNGMFFQSCAAGNCANDVGRTLYSSGPTATFTFGSDYSVTHSGYLIEWSCATVSEPTTEPTQEPTTEPTPEPTTEPTSTPEPTTTPEPTEPPVDDHVLNGLGYVNNENILRSFECLADQVVKFEILEMNLESCCDHVTFFNSYPGSIFYQSCSNTSCASDVGRTFYSSGPSATFQFTSDYSVTLSGFLIRWDCVAPTPTPVPQPGCMNMDEVMTCDVVGSLGVCGKNLPGYSGMGHVPTIRDVCPLSCGCCERDGQCVCDNDNLVEAYLASYGVRSCKQLFSLNLWFVSCTSPYTANILRKVCPCECSSPSASA